MTRRSDQAAAACGLLRRARSGALATRMAADGAPYASLVTVATAVDGAPLFLLSGLADHTRNLAGDPRASLLIEEARSRANPQTGPRVSLQGTIRVSEDAGHRARFLARHPDAALYAGFADFNVYRLDIERVHFVGGFARAAWLAPQAVIEDAKDAATIAGIEQDALAHLNQDHVGGLDVMAQRLLGRRGEGWRAIALDPGGCDLARGKSFARLDFPSRVGSATELRTALAGLAKKARKNSVK